MNRRWSALALSTVALGAVAVTAAEASADPKDPQGSSVVVPQGWPDEGSGYPGASSVSADPRDWPDEGSGFPGADNKAPEYNYPNYDPKYELEYRDPRYGVTPVQAPLSASASASTSDDAAAALQAGASALGGAGVAFGVMWLFRRNRRLAG